MLPSPLDSLRLNNHDIVWGLEPENYHQLGVIENTVTQQNLGCGLQKVVRLSCLPADATLLTLLPVSTLSKSMSTLLPAPLTARPRLHRAVVWPRLIQKWMAYLLAPVDGTSMAAFRVLFGGLLFWEVLRYFQHGWIERYYITPAFHFTYPFLDFIRPWPGNGMYLHFAVMGALALLIALGCSTAWRPRCFA